jgi:hypothetical protein
MYVLPLVDWVWQEKYYATGFRYVAIPHVTVAVSTVFQQVPQTSNDIIHDQHMYNITSQILLQIGFPNGPDDRRSTGRL